MAGIIRRLELRQFEVLKLSDLDQIKNCFHAQIFTEWCFPGGALPEEADGLNAGGSDFPMGADGRPTFRPPAGWYLDKFEISNIAAGKSMKLLDSAIKAVGDDIMLTLRWEGSFYEMFELNDVRAHSRTLPPACQLMACTSRGGAAAVSL